METKTTYFEIRNQRRTLKRENDVGKLILTTSMQTKVDKIHTSTTI